jgi:N-acyl-L-homoserine lactone synthetase
MNENGKPASIPDWMEEVRLLRGSVFYADGRRPHFKIAQGEHYDPDPIDLHAYHVLAYRDYQLVGCVRVLPLVSNAARCTTEVLLGTKVFSEMLLELGAQRTTTAEIGRPGNTASCRLRCCLKTIRIPNCNLLCRHRR